MWGKVNTPWVSKPSVGLYLPLFHKQARLRLTNLCEWNDHN